MLPLLLGEKEGERHTLGKDIGADAQSLQRANSYLNGMYYPDIDRDYRRYFER